jgi:hypothetical protein
VSDVGGRIVGSNLLSLARFAGGCPAFGRERSAGGGGEDRFAGTVAGVSASEVISIGGKQICFDDDEDDDARGSHRFC